MTLNSEASSLALAPSYETDSVVNGSFLRGVETGAAETPLGDAWREATERGEYALGEMAEVLRDFREQSGPVRIAELVGNTAFRGIGNDGFNDTSTNRGLRSITDYVIPDERGAAGIMIDGVDASSVNELKGFNIEHNKGPIALVALDPARLGKIKDSLRRQLIVELHESIEIMLNPQVPKEEKMQRKMSDELKAILGWTLISNNSFIQEVSDDGTPEEWELPFDYIASLKALYVLLSHDSERDDNFKDNSGKLRQGAVLLTNESGDSIVVGCSGLDSGLDEPIAAFYARLALGIESR